MIPAPPPRDTFPFPLDQEVEGELAIVLWRALRDAMWWAHLTGDERGSFYSPPTANVREHVALACDSRQC